MGRKAYTDRNAEIVAAFQAGETQLSIAERHGVSRARISYLCRRYGRRYFVCGDCGQRFEQPAGKLGRRSTACPGDCDSAPEVSAIL